MIEQTPSTRPRWVKRALLVVFVLVAAGFVFRNAILGAPVEVYRAVRSDLVQSVVASGRIATPQRVSVGTVITGRVMRIPVKEGQSVKQGEVLIQLDDDDERAAVEQSRGAVAQPRPGYASSASWTACAEQARSRPRRTTPARQQYQRSIELKAKGFVSQAASMMPSEI